jgi:hypothetical protein
MSLRHGKILLRQLAAQLGAPLTSLKRGFAVPLGAYFAGPWLTEARDWFGSLESELIDPEAATSLLYQEEAPVADLWMLATLAAWEDRLRRARFAAGRESTASSFASSP